jgi:hypothetical protein
MVVLIQPLDVDDRWFTAEDDLVKSLMEEARSMLLYSSAPIMA